MDVCGKNAELTLQSRVKGFTKEMLSGLLYKDRLLVDYTDKELAIWPSEDWPYFSGYRERSISRLRMLKLHHFFGISSEDWAQCFFQRQYNRFLL